ncbi:MAG: hypothetical protein ABIZ49_09665, partial [Opitutaceae bacterium]
MTDSRTAPLAAFVQWAQAHITGDEKWQAQIPAMTDEIELAPAIGKLGSRGRLSIACAVVLAIPVAVFAQTARVRFTSLSLLLRPPTAARAEGNFGVLFSTPSFTGSFSITKAPNPLTSQELAPVNTPGSGDYATDFLVVRDGIAQETGRINLALPTADANGNQLPDFLETDSASEFAVSGSAASATSGGQSRAYRVEARFSRAANI